MSHPHDYLREQAPKAYLKREFVEPIPRQITFAGMIGSYRIFVLDLSQYYSAIKSGAGEPFICSAIQNDKGGIHGVRGTVSHYVLVVDDKTIARYDTDGRFIDEPGDVPLPTAKSSARLKGTSSSLQLK
jgi:hypothetical protein